MEDFQKSSSATDSPWFWLYLFATAALIGIILIKPKFETRQSNIESKAIARISTLEAQNAESDLDKEAPPKPDSAPRSSSRTTTVNGLIALFSILLCVGWIVFWLQNRRENAKQAESQTEKTN